MINLVEIDGLVVDKEFNNYAELNKFVFDWFNNQNKIILGGKND